MPSPAPPDHYATLGVAPSAAHATIQAAYRRTMRTVHPDLAGDDPSAAARALAANTAWAVLRDPRARAAYDRQRAAAASAAVPGTADRAVSTWAVGGVPPVTAQHLREAAARQSAFSALGRQQRQAFSAASQRVGVMILLIGALLLTLVIAR